LLESSACCAWFVACVRTTCVQEQCSRHSASHFCNYFPSALRTTKTRTRVNRTRTPSTVPSHHGRARFVPFCSATDEDDEDEDEDEDEDGKEEDDNDDDDDAASAAAPAGGGGGCASRAP
jgi:hypothetical protein